MNIRFTAKEIAAEAERRGVSVVEVIAKMLNMAEVDGLRRILNNPQPPTAALRRDYKSMIIKQEGDKAQEEG